MSETLFGITRKEVKTYDKQKGITKPVLQIKDGIVINRFSSIVEAGRRTNILSTSISDVCRGKNKTTGGFSWKYAEYEMPKKEKTKTTKVSFISNVKKAPFKVVIAELCDTEEDAKTLLNSIIKTGIIRKNSARILRTRNKKSAKGK